MYKNPSFGTLIFTIRKNCEQHNFKDCTIACVVSSDGIMMIYDSVEELLQVTLGEFLPYLSEQRRVDIIVTALRDKNSYFFHKSYEYIPARMPTPSMSAKIMMFKEVLALHGITIRPANTLNDSGKCYTDSKQLLADSSTYAAMGMPFADKDITFLKNCMKNSLVHRMLYPYNQTTVYSLKIDPPPKVSADPVVIFKDEKKRLAMARKPLHEYIGLYKNALENDSSFITMIYPDGTAANMTDYIDLELDLHLTKEDVIAYLYDYLEWDDGADELDDDCIFSIKLEILRLVVIVGSDTIILPTPITPQQSVFLEGLQELGHVWVEDAKILSADDLSRYGGALGRTFVPLRTTSGFLFGGSEFFVRYDLLSPDMKKKVDSVMNITEENKNDYMFDATSADNILVMRSEDAL